MPSQQVYTPSAQLYTPTGATPYPGGFAALTPDGREQNMFRGSVAMQTGEILWARGELLGEGAYGKVFAGLNQLTGELMAVKQLKVCPATVPCLPHLVALCTVLRSAPRCRPAHGWSSASDRVP